MTLLRLTAALLCIAGCAVAQDGQVKLEADILKGYNRKHRPVKDDKTTLGVTILMSITHIEKVNEEEQTAIVHGSMFAAWKDEYLTWNPADYNNSNTIYLETWKIWQPALSLYNSARGNQWNLYLGGSPASIDNKGQVMAHGSFSFHVTCQFDFEAWPNDEHKCPIVIADWVYDLSRVNLSEVVNGVSMDPYVNLHYDPFDEREKKHVAGWQIVSTWRKHCYWGKKWCQDEIDAGESPESYWSVLEFGIKIRRHAPYIIFTLVLPTLLSSGLTLITFWIDNYQYPIILLLFNLIFQGLYGWDMVRQMPAGNGLLPDMIFYFGFNAFLTVMALVVHVLLDHVPRSLPQSFEMPEQISSFFTHLRYISFFTKKGFSFDPAELYGTSLDDEEGKSTLPSSSISTSASSALLAGFEETGETGEILLQMEEAQSKPTTSAAPVTVDNEVPLVEVDQQSPSNGDAVVEMGDGEQKLPELPPASREEHAQLVRRIIFCLFALVYVWEIPRAFF